MEKFFNFILGITEEPALVFCAIVAVLIILFLAALGVYFVLVWVFKFLLSCIVPLNFDEKHWEEENMDEEILDQLCEFGYQRQKDDEQMRFVYAIACHQMWMHLYEKPHPMVRKFRKDLAKMKDLFSGIVLSLSRDEAISIAKAVSANVDCQVFPEIVQAHRLIRAGVAPKL